VPLPFGTYRSASTAFAVAWTPVEGEP
jgi:hypothetical protein